MWGGSNSYLVTANVSLITAFNNFANNAPTDPDAAMYLAFAYAEGEYVSVSEFTYAKPIANPPIFHEFTAIESLASTLRITNLTDLVSELELKNPSGFRELYTTITFRNSPALQAQILELFVSEMNTINDAEGILPALVMQPITKDMISNFGKNGGNALGIAEADGPLIREADIISSLPIILSGV